MQKKTDRRVRKTKSQLKTGLAQLMREKSIREITVKELVDAVDINRSTFYLHYSDIPGLLAEVENEMMEEMQRYVREHHMENVKFLGYLQKDEMSEKFYQAKAVIMTSQCYEAFAMTIAEAYSYGVPVIAGRVGNMDGMVQDGITGVKFTYNSAEDLADKISAFDAMELSVLKKNARAFYAERLRPEDNYQKLIRIYEDISK